MSKGEIAQPVFNRGSVFMEYEKLAPVLNVHLEAIKNIVTSSGTPLEGNCFYTHGTLNLYKELLFKQVNLFWCGKQCKTRVCEIGFNAGHSALLLLLSAHNIELDFTVFDIGQHKYTKPSVNYIKTSFPHISLEYIEGDSIEEMPKWIDAHSDLKGAYDVVHVDGGHTYECVKSDMIGADSLVKVGGIIIVDDTNVKFISRFVDEYCNDNRYRELSVFSSMGYEHRIIQKLR